MAHQIKTIDSLDCLYQSKAVLDEIRRLNGAPDETPISNRQASLLTGVAESTLEQWRSTRRIHIPYYKFGKSVRYRLGDVRDFIKESRIQSESPQLTDGDSK